MNFFNQGIPLGRWFGIHVVISWMFFLAVWWILQEFTHNVELGILFIVLLFGTVLVHEFGHALSCLMIGGKAHQIVLGPLGGAAYIQPPNNPGAWLFTTVCGPAVNAILWPASWAACVYGLPALSHVMNPDTLAYHLIAQICILMLFINKGLLLFNLIPSYPMDGGRLLQEILWMLLGYRRSLQIAGMVGTVAGIAFIVLGMGLYPIKIPFLDFTLGKEPDIFLAAIGLMCAFESFGIYRNSEEIKSWRKN